MLRERCVRSRLLAVAFVVAASATGADPQEPQGSLTIRFTGLEEVRGELMVSLADSSEAWESDGEPQHGARIRVEGAEASATFRGLPAGEYAAKAFHDANGNRELDMGFTGPKEKFGFSNNVMGFMGPPDFDDAKFRYDGGTLQITLDAF